MVGHLTVLAPLLLAVTMAVALTISLNIPMAIPVVSIVAVLAVAPVKLLVVSITHRVRRPGTGTRSIW